MRRVLTAVAATVGPRTLGNALRIIVLVGLSATGLAVSAAPAHAATTIYVDGNSWLHVGTGVSNDVVTVEGIVAGPSCWNPATCPPARSGWASARITNSAEPVAAGSGCYRVSTHTIECSAPRGSDFLALSVSTGAGQDRVTLTDRWTGSVSLGDGSYDQVTAEGGVASDRNLRIYGGPGQDDIRIPGYHTDVTGDAGTDQVMYMDATCTNGVEVTLDNIANDGCRGSYTDHIRPDVENVMGSRYNDLLVGSGHDNRFVGWGGADDIRGGGGFDTANYAFSHGAPVTVTLDGRPNDGSANEGDNVGNDVEKLVGGTRNDILIGNGLANVLDGHLGDDQLYGRGGNDTFLDYVGADTFSGEAGLDTASYERRTEGVRVDMDDVADDAQDPYGNFDNVLADVENVTGGAGNDRLIGNTSANVLRGMGGADRLAGGGGNDTLYGGAGNDTLVGGNGTDACYVEADGGTTYYFETT